MFNLLINKGKNYNKEQNTIIHLFLIDLRKIKYFINRNTKYHSLIINYIT